MNDATQLFRQARATAGTVRRDSIPVAVMDLYRRARALQVAGVEPYPSASWKELNALRWDLHRALGRKPWQHHVIDELGTEPPERDGGCDWAGAVELRRQLDAAIAP
jgi:hypothetical protein